MFPNLSHLIESFVLNEIDPVVLNYSLPPDPDPEIFGTLDLEGFLLGKESDDVFVALYQAGQTVRLFDTFAEILPAPPAQTQLRVQITDAVPPGNYRVILRVNTQQAQNSPEGTLP